MPTKPSPSPTWIELSLDRSGDEIRVSARGSRGEQTAPRALGAEQGVAAMRRFADAVRQAAARGEPLASALVTDAQAAERALLAGKTEPLFAVLGAAAGGPLLVRFMIHDPELQAVPWEALCKPGETLGFWGSSPDLLAARGVTSSKPWQPCEVRGAVRVLAIAPTGSGGLATLKYALADRIATGEVEWLDPIAGQGAHVPGLFDRLRREPIPHVLHFLGYGGIDKGMPTLRLADDDDGHETWLQVDLLTQQLEAGFRDVLRLVILEACEGTQPYALASAAEILARAGADAVVAHLWPIKSDVARVFSAQLYRSLVGADRGGGDIARAMNEARRATLGAFAATAQALSPVLYLRGPHGILFDFEGRKSVPFRAPVLQNPRSVSRDDELASPYDLPPKGRTPPRSTVDAPRTRILFLAANPDSTAPLHTGREMRRIRERLAVAAHRSAIEIVERSAVRPGDLQQALMEVEPHVVHFSGHGNTEYELMLEDDDGSPRPVGKGVLAELFRLRGGGVRLVVLCACHSFPQAETIAEHVDCAIGMRRAFGSEAAAEFSGALYHALGSGDSIRRAFDSARLHLEATGIPEHRTPQLAVKKDGVDIERSLVTDPGAQPRRASTEPAPFHVPFLRNPSFVGRDDDLARLHDLLQKGSAVGVRPAALTGMGGIGKTQLAVEYVYRYAKAYPGGVYWVNAAEPVQAEFARLAIDVGLEDETGSERQRRLALAFAKRLGERQDALAIFDNVEDPLALRSPKPGFIPAQLGCRLLFTTRRRDPDSSFETVDVRVLPEDIALRLLLSGGVRRLLLESGPTAELDAAKTICASLGYLPLALVLAAAFLARYPRIALSDYLTRIRREGALAAADAANVDPRRLGTLHDPAVGATLRTQWDAIVSEDAKLVLTTAALLGNATLVPRARLVLLTGLAEIANPGYPAPLEEAILDLSGLSLVEELSEHEIRLHPLVREFAEKQIEGREVFAAACAARLGEALLDMGRLHEEVAGRGIDAVLEDLRMGSTLAVASGQARLTALIRPLDRESHALRGWDPVTAPGFLLQQLRNRCFELEIEDVWERAETKLEEQMWPWLREGIRTSRESAALVRTLEGHTAWVIGAAVTVDGHIVSASWDETLKVWDLGTGQVVHTLERHASAVNCVAVTADSRFAVSASHDKTLKVWDLGTGQTVRTLEGHTDSVLGVAMRADGCFAVSASSDKTLKVWDLGTGQAVRTLEGHTDAVLGVAVPGDGRFAVSASSDNMLKVWDLGTGQAVRTLEGHASAVTGVAVTADGRFAVSASWDHTLKVWDLGTGQAIHTLKGHTSRVTGVAVTADGRFAVSASADHALKLWDLGTGRWMRTLQGHTERVTGVAVTADGRCAVSASWDRTLKVWDLGAGRVARALEGHASSVTGLAVTADGRFAVSAASRDHALKVWDLDTGRVVRTLEGHTAWVTGVTVTADGRFAVSASYDTLKVWDLGTGQAVRTFHGHTAWVAGVAVTADGRFAVSAAKDHTLKVWDLDTGRAVHTLEGHTTWVTGVVMTADGRFAVSASEDYTLKVWDLGAGRAVHTLKGHGREVRGVAVTADGRLAVSASGDKTLKVWDLDTGRAVRTLKGHGREVRGVAVTADGRFAVSASADKTLKVWDLDTGQPLATLETHAPLRCCAVTPDSKTLLAGDDAGALHILAFRNGGV